jgi:hypothetical protein
MNERDFEIGGRKFKLNKIDTFKQFHIVRRLAPILGDLIPAAQKLKNVDDKKGTEEEKFEAIAKLAQPLMNGFAKLSDADSNLVLLGLCSAVEMQQMPTGNWARLSNGELMMIQDLPLQVLLQVAGRALQFNMAGFFDLLPQVSPGGK